MSDTKARDQTMTDSVLVMMTAADKEVVRGKAKDAQLSLSSFMRHAALGKRLQSRVDAVVLQLIAQANAMVTQAEDAVRRGSLERAQATLRHAKEVLASVAEHL